MGLITINEERCIKCEACVQECPEAVIKMESIGPAEVNAERCIACGHCVAICPNEAIDNVKSPLMMQSKMTNTPRLSPEEAKNFIRSRRSIRTYKVKPVEREKLRQLVEVANLAPSPGGLSGLSYLIIDDKKTIETLVEECITWAENDPNWSIFLSGVTKRYREHNIDAVLRNAPSIIIALADKDFYVGRESSILALTYLELFAPSLELGSCWAGLFELYARSEASSIYKVLNLPKGKQITGCVMVGYPKYSYKRFTGKQPVSVSFYNE